MRRTMLLLPLLERHNPLVTPARSRRNRLCGLWEEKTISNQLHRETATVQDPAKLTIPIRALQMLLPTRTPTL